MIKDSVCPKMECFDLPDSLYSSKHSELIVFEYSFQILDSFFCLWKNSLRFNISSNLKDCSSFLRERKIGAIGNSGFHPLHAG